jgi:hypothetical protein
MNTEFEKIKKANVLINSLCIFTNLKEDSVLIKYKKLLKYLNKKDISIDKGITFYNDFVYELLKKAEGTSFKKYIIDLIFLDNNSFTAMIDREDLSNKHIIDQVKYELKALEYITNINSNELKEAIIHKCKAKEFESEIITSLIDYEVNSNEDYNSYKAMDKLKLNILNCDNWGDSLENIIEFYKQYGTGIFGEYRAFVWEHEEDRTYLRGIDAPDPLN